MRGDAKTNEGARCGEEREGRVSSGTSSICLRAACCVPCACAACRASLRALRALRLLCCVLVGPHLLMHVSFISPISFPRPSHFTSCYLISQCHPPFPHVQWVSLMLDEYNSTEFYIFKHRPQAPILKLCSSNTQNPKLL